MYEGGPPGSESLRAAAGTVASADLTVQEFLPRLARDLFGGEAQADDLTLLALEMCEQEAEVAVVRPVASITAGGKAS